MRHRLPVLLAAGLATVGLGACGSDDAPTIDPGAVDATATTVAPPTSSTTTTAIAPPSTMELQTLTLTLTGDAEVPGPGSSGTAQATLTYDGDQLCVEGSTEGVGAVTAAHIHAGAAGESGPPVVPLPIETDGDGPFQGCERIGAEGGVVFVDPASYYLNLHTAELPDGAVRAQLG